MAPFCCRRRLTADATMHALEQELISTLNASDHIHTRTHTLKSIGAYASLTMYVLPILIAVLAGVASKTGLLHTILPASLAEASGKQIALLIVVCVCPLALSYALTRTSAALCARYDAQLQKLAGVRAKLLGRIKTELPMAQALTLLSKYDPSGDHTALISAPPHMMDALRKAQDGMDALRAEREQLLKLANYLIETLGGVAPGGWAQARECLHPATHVLAKYQAALPAAANLLIPERGGSLDTLIMGKLLATPAAPRTVAKPPASAASVAATPAAAQHPTAPASALPVGKLLPRLEETVGDDADAAAEPSIVEQKREMSNNNAKEMEEEEDPKRAKSAK